MFDFNRRKNVVRRRAGGAATLLLALLGAACGGPPKADPTVEIGRALTSLTISGRIALNGGGAMPGVTVTLAGTRGGTQVTDADGNYAFSGLPTGSYSVRPTPVGVSFAPDVVNLNGLTGDVVQRFYGTPLPGGWAPSRVFGQVDITETTTNMVVPNRVFHPGGLFVDRMAAPTPSRLWLFDSGNNRILGFRTVGTCAGGPTPGAPCTEHSGCGSGGSCANNLSRNADLVLGQPSTSDRASCNGDNTRRMPASRSALCLAPFPLTVSPAEGPTGGQMAMDSAHNLYVVDLFNNRVLRFDDPFTHDTQPDKVWGQRDFNSRECNQGFASPAADRLCTGNMDDLPLGFFGGAVDVTPDGSLWVADLGNNRVLRFPANGTSANLVLGEPDMQSNVGCDGSLSRLCRPVAVRFDPTTNRLYVADGNGEDTRVLVWQNPSTNGQPASTQLAPPAGSIFLSVRGFTLDPTTPGAVWFADTDNSRLLQYINLTPAKVLGQPNFSKVGCDGFPTDGPLEGTICSPHGSIGIDRDGTVYAGDLDDQQRVDRFRGPQMAPRPDGLGRSPDAFLLNQGNVPASHAGVPNRIGPAGFNGPNYVLLTPAGMIAADRFRLLFWRNYTTGGLNGGNADGVLAQPDFFTEDRFFVTHGDVFVSLALDATRNLLYATNGNFITVWSTQNGLQSGAAPAFEIASPLPLRGGGSIDFNANGIAVDTATNTAWISDGVRNRMLRILNVSQGSRQVDTVFGQPNATTTDCNRGGGRFAPVRNGLCACDQVTFDRVGNLYVIDGTWEAGGNQRALEFDRSSLPSIPAAQVFWPTGGPMPTRVYAKASFNAVDCDPDFVHQPCTPRYVSFEPGTNRMVMTVDACGSNCPRNPLEDRAFLYNNPVPAGVVAPQPSGHIPLPFNQAGASSWDSARRLAIMDHTWSRVVLIPSPPQ